MASSSLCSVGPSATSATSSSYAAASAALSTKSFAEFKGFYYARCSKTIECVLCGAPWDSPVELVPCGHVFCYGCVCDAERCLTCSSPIDHLIQPTDALVQLCREVHVLCEHCDWTGNRDNARKHVCRGRKRQLCIHGILNGKENSSTAWFALACTLKLGETVNLFGTSYDKVGLYLKSLDLNCSSASAWSNLGAAMSGISTVEHKNVKMTKSSCYVRALEIDSYCASAWFNLGNCMRVGDMIEVMGTPVYKDTCYLRSVEINDNFPDGWYNLGLSIEPGMVIDYGPHELVARDCFLRAVLANATFSLAWNELGLALTAKKTVKYKGHRMCKKDCFTMAIETFAGAGGLRSPQFSEAWYHLAATIKVDEYACLFGSNYTKEECAVKGKHGARAGHQAQPRGSIAGGSDSGRSSRGTNRSTSSSTARKKKSSWWWCSIA